MQSLSVYIHIPFCVRKCHYCDFLSAPATKEKMTQYLDALKKEIYDQAKKYQEYEIKTIFLGGGTPSILDGEDIVDLLSLLRQECHICEEAEITIEMNPATADQKKMELWKKAGVNRLSIGLQSVHDEELKMLGRVHTYKEFVESYEMARKMEFMNINIDLMSALPGQSMQTWEDTLQKVIALKPEHISAYSLIIEEGTALYQNLDKYPPIPSEDDDRNMYQMTKEKLKEAGFERYEISNYAKPGFESKHNSVYWERENYVGFGLGASSMVQNERWTNESDFERYLANVSYCEKLKQEKEKLSKRECMEEYMFLGMRMMKGVRKHEFEKQFHVSMDEIFGTVIQKYEKQNLIQQDDKMVKLTDHGIDVSNVIFSDFLE